MTSLKEMYTDYLSTQVEGATFQKELSNAKYSCWMIPVERKQTVTDWLGNLIENRIVINSHYVWLGNKGAVYVSGSPYIKKNDNINPKFHLMMKKWAWKKYFNIEL